MKTHYLFIAAFLLIAQWSFSQHEPLTGVLLDVNNKIIKNHPVTLGRVSPVTVKTDKYGIFIFPNANLQDTLFVGDKKGLNPIAIPVNGHPYVTIQSLKGNFNTAYLSEPDVQLLRILQQMEKDRLKSSTTLRREDIERSGCRDVLCLLRMLSGVTVSGNSVRIRGTSSSSMLSGVDSNAPLIILDGVPASGDAFYITVEDLESVSVLKDASIYGVRGANGAILINTKK